MASIPDGAVIRRRQDVVANDLSATELVMLDVERGLYFGMQDVGKTIWASLAEDTTFDSICSELLDRYEVDEQTCRREVADFLEQLAQLELIDVRSGDPTP